jgi:hypothetical protein
VNSKVKSLYKIKATFLPFLGSKNKGKVEICLIKENQRSFLKINSIMLGHLTPTAYLPQAF